MKVIYLVGMPGSGKTTIGKELARELRMEFLDTDEVIMNQYGKTAEEIILSEGEEVLRMWEALLMDELQERKDLVVSTGGGLPLFHGNMEKMNRSGITVYLEYPAETLWKRLKGDRERPLSRSYQDTASLLQKRTEVYRKATVIIKGNEDRAKNFQEIMRRLRELL